jgi:hypothetical protein
MSASVRGQPADFEQVKRERLDLGEQAVQRRLVGHCSRQHGVLALRLSPQGGERGAHRLAEAAAHTDFVAPRLRVVACGVHVLTTHRTGQPATLSRSSPEPW